MNGQQAAGEPKRFVNVHLRMDFTGWRHFVIPFEEFDARGSKDPLLWDKIASVTFDSTRQMWLRPPADPATVLLLDDLKVIMVDKPALGQGPRLTDAEFFAALDLNRPDLAAVKADVAKADYAAARHAFAEHIRRRKSPRWLEMWWERPAPDPKYNTAVADRIVAGEIQMGEAVYKPQGRIDWSYNPPVYQSGPKATVEYNAGLDRFYHFKDLFDAYWNTSQEKYAQEMVKEMVGFAQDCPVLLFQDGNSPYHYAWETLNTAARLIHYCPIAIYRSLDSPAWTDEAILTVWKSLYEQVQHLLRCYTSGNWLASEMRGVYYVGLLNPEFKEAPSWRQFAIGKLYDQLQHEVYPDGIQYELALGYDFSALHNFTGILDLAQLNGKMGEFPPDYMGRLEKMYNYALYAMMPNDRIPGLNDAGVQGEDPDPEFLQAAKYFPKRQDFVWAATHRAQGTQPSPNSVAFPYAGHYVMRTGWDPQQDLYLIFDAGPWGAGHQHEDKLTFDAYAYGRLLLTEGGVCMYDESPQRKYVLSTRAHNTIRVDGQDQRRAATENAHESWKLSFPFKPLNNPWFAGPDFDFAEGTYEDGYGGRQVVAQVKHTRSILFVKPHYWIITDTLVPADDKVHSYESLFHLNAASAACEGLTVTSTEEGANLQIMAAPREGLTVKIVQGQEQPEYQGWTERNFTTMKPIATAVYQWQAKGSCQVTYVLSPLAAKQVSSLAGIKPLEISGTPALATALQLQFADGSRDAYFYASTPPGVPGPPGEYRFGQFRGEGRGTLLRFDPRGQQVAAWLMP